jgi:hypothetical protein
MAARAMVSATLSTQLIAEHDSNSRALLFAQFQRRVRRQRAKALIKQGHLTQQKADELEAEELAQEETALAAQAAAGTRPAERLGDSRHGWSGLTDYAFANRFGKSGWYDLFYGPMSDQIACERGIARCGNYEPHRRRDNNWRQVREPVSSPYGCLRDS